jgi:CRISPR-associated protein Cas2
MLYVVCYDISDDTARAAMSRNLLDFGVRIQESVFECVLDDTLMERLLGTITLIPLADSDRVRLYRLCAGCTDRVQIWGPGEVTADPPFYLV